MNTAEKLQAVQLDTRAPLERALLRARETRDIMAKHGMNYEALKSQCKVVELEAKLIEVERVEDELIEELEREVYDSVPSLDWYERELGMTIRDVEESLS